MEVKRKKFEKEMEKEKRLQDAERKKNDLRMRLTQRKITETMKKIPKEKLSFWEEDGKNRRLEMKENLWRKWRGKKPEKR
jgi:hypothetical protein